MADLDRLCDELGLDTIETGAALAVYMDAGRMDWGDAGAMKALLEKIEEGGEAERAIGNGAVATGKLTGHARVSHAKGQSVPAWDPRPLKATGVTYCTSPMGADHTAGLVVNPGLSPDDFVWESQKAQIVNAVCDSSGFCQFLQPTLDDIRNFYAAMLGDEVTREQIHDQGWQCLRDEWAFNQRAGLSDADDTLSEPLRTDPIAGQVFDVPASVVKKMYTRLPARDDLFETKASG